MKILLVYILFCVGLNVAEETQLIRIPMERMETGLEKLLRRGADLKLIEGIYDMQRRAAKPSRLVMQNGKPIPTNDTLPLFKYFDTQYYGLINIGKPGKTFKMVMDTAWAFTWVPSVECPLTSIACARHERYDHKGSSTYKEDGTPFNISNKYIGYLSNDLFLVGQMNVTGQKFAELNHIPWIYALYEADGTLGLGFDKLSPNVTPLFYNFYTQNNLAPIFSFYVNRDPTTKRGGSVFFGGIDFKHNKTAFTTVDVISKYYWQFKMDKVTLVMSKKSQQEYCKGGCYALADTSANTIVGPPAEVNDINRLIGATEIFFSNRFMIPCINEFKGPKVKFTIANQEFQILARDYIQKISYSGITLCLSAFQPAEPSAANNTWVLGGAFLYQYYTAYDIVKRKIMIAEAA
ncbi:lysosomal aspartic protease-like [Macrosteles quadrilineatus]|uniref:lysosomal aspartic protease-like n=1 Tax=Macrosteles quadrilineatus TaxID=74068 RepID=UPI0023E1B937|nr:lysosomal aspartic protease-like [Macrosteles quadrilineatus]XP_054279796.1 lysosomal aspartic protease-like [Macrosteles quadrilineatus]